MKKKISVDELLAFAKGVEGETQKTLHRHAEFTFEIKGDALIIMPSKSNKPRAHDKMTLQKICAEFSKTNSLSPSHYIGTTGTWNASYALTLISLCLKLRLS